MRRLVPRLTLFVILSLLLGLLAASPVAAQPTELVAELSGEKEVPGPGDPDGRGFSSVMIDPDAGSLCFFIHVENIDLPATGAHIHQGAKGVAGDIVVPLTPPDAQGFADGCLEGQDPALLQSILDDPQGFYVNVHNEAFPAGAVRGQLRVPPPVLFAELTGAAEVPGPGDPDGSGFAQLAFFPGRGRVCVHIEVSGIAEPTGAHIHQGEPGVAGDIVLPLPTPNAQGMADECIEDVDRAIIGAILENPAGYYVNVHTAEFPAGAVRGQLAEQPAPEPPPDAELFATLTGAAEVPGPGDPDGGGSASLAFFVDAGRVCHYIAVNGITVATGAHIHEGVAGEAGPIVVTLLTPDPTGVAEGCVEGQDPAVLQAIIDNPAGYYVNVHTAEFPAGAVRGQLSTEPPPPATCTPPTLCNGTAPAGAYLYGGFGTQLSFSLAQEWGSVLFTDGFGLISQTQPIALFTQEFAGQVFGPPCGTDVVQIENNVASLAGWFADHPALEATEPQPVTIGGASGLYVDTTARLPAECGGQVSLVPGAGGDAAFFVVEGEQVRFIVLDVAGETIIFFVDAFEGDLETLLPSVQAVLDTMVWALEGAPTATPAPTQTVRGATASPRAAIPNTATDGNAPVTGPLLPIAFAALAGVSALALRRRPQQRNQRGGG